MIDRIAMLKLKAKIELKAEVKLKAEAELKAVSPNLNLNIDYCHINSLDDPIGSHYVQVSSTYKTNYCCYTVEHLIPVTLIPSPTINPDSTRSPLYYKQTCININPKSIPKAIRTKLTMANDILTTYIKEIINDHL